MTYTSAFPVNKINQIYWKYVLFSHVADKSCNRAKQKPRMQQTIYLNHPFWSSLRLLKKYLSTSLSWNAGVLETTTNEDKKYKVDT